MESVPTGPPPPAGNAVARAESPPTWRGPFLCAGSGGRATLPIVFVAAVAMGVAETVCHARGRGSLPGAVAEFLRYALPVAPMLAFATRTLGARRGPALIVLAMAAGLAAEAHGVRGGGLFGGRYVYHGVGPVFLGVPMVVLLFWAVFIHAGYSLTNSFLCWLGVEKPARRARSDVREIGAGQRESRGLALLPALVLADALAVVAIDVLLDPLLVRGGLWSWPDGGEHFGVPVGNFLGWMAVTAAATAPFRLLEYIRPRPADCPRWVHLIPPACYAVLCLLLTAWSLRLGFVGLALAGPAGMGFLAAANFALYLRGRATVGAVRPAPNAEPARGAD